MLHPDRVTDHDEGDRRTREVYRERIWPSVWVWLVSIGLTGSVGIAYGAAYGFPIGLLAFVGLGALSLIGLMAASPTIIVTTSQVRAGRAAIPCTVLTRCAELDAAGMKRALGLPDPSLFILVRPWMARQGVILEVDDPDDPHTSWVLSTKRPEAFTQALGAVGIPRMR